MCRVKGALQLILNATGGIRGDAVHGAEGWENATMPPRPSVARWGQMDQI